MKKKTNIFGFDRTPRKALWAEIEQQNKQIQSLMAERGSSKPSNQELVRGLEITLEVVRKSLKEAESSLCKKNKEIAVLQEKLARYARPKDKYGKFTKTKIAKQQIEAVEQKQNEYKLIGQMVKVSGHTLFKFNTTTRTAGRAAIEEKIIAEVNPRTGQLETRTTVSVNVEKDCYYEQALNMANFIKRLRRRGIIGPEEIVAVEN